MYSVPQLRTLVVLGRVSGLPTVWSNVLAGWCLGGGGNHWKLPFLFLGVSVLHTGGAFLNDAFDFDSDRLQRPDRPIPAGQIAVDLVWRLGFGLLAAGIFLLVFCSQVSAGAAIFLALFILLFNFSHKFFTAAPWLMGLCRFWVYIIAGAAGTTGLNGWVIYSGAAITFYVAGMDYVTRRQTFRASVPHWPLLLLAIPALLALVINEGHFRWLALGFSLPLLLWIGLCVRTVVLRGEINVDWITSNLFAGIVLVDWLAVAPQITWWLGVVLFAPLFGVSWWFPKLLPVK